MSLFAPTMRRAPEPAKAGPVGPGAGVLMTEYLLPSFLQADPAAKIRRSCEMGISVPWIRAAERVIGSKFGGVEWHLEDPDGTPIDDDYPDGRALGAVEILANPQGSVGLGRKLTRRALWKLTSRHMGLAGSAFWYLDQVDALGIPHAVLYIRPDRLTPVPDARGNLVRWILDADPNGGGMPLELDEVMQTNLDEPDDGHFGVGLVESAMMKATLSQSVDRHMNEIISAGGRLAGILAPKTGIIESDQIYEQMVRDWRNITEQPQAAKRAQIVRAPVDFTKTTANPQELRIVELMTEMRDDLLALWGVPLSQLGGTTPAGLNGGDIRGYDEAALWQTAVHDRLVEFRENVQRCLLDPWEALLGWAPVLVVEEPEFDDEAPKYELVAKALNLPMTNRERRALVGLEPFGDPLLDDAIYLPVTLTRVDTAPAETAEAVIEEAEEEIDELDPTEMTREARAAGETSEIAPQPSKAALATTVTRLRERVASRMTPKVRSAVERVLAEQKRDVAERVRTHADLIARKPGDTSTWWDAKRWDAALVDALRPHLEVIAETVRENVAGKVAPKLTPGKATFVGDAIDYVLMNGAARVTGINTTTRDALAQLIADGIDEGLAAAELGDLIEGASVFDEYRSELIARTELADAYNTATIGAYDELGVEKVEAIDGDGDEECAARNGQVFTLEEAAGIEDHPNGTLDWLPVLD